MRTIVFDFDGVIHRYRNGWQDGTIYDEPNYSIIPIIDALRCHYGYKVVIVSTRCNTEEGLNDIKTWCDKYNIKVDDILKEKPPALVYIDDRAINFDPNNNNLLNEILMFNTQISKYKEYEKLTDLEKVGMIKIRQSEFNRINKELYSQENEVDPIIQLKILDEWIATVKKYLK